MNARLLVPSSMERLLHYPPSLLKSRYLPIFFNADLAFQVDAYLVSDYAFRVLRQNIVVTSCGILRKQNQYYEFPAQEENRPMSI
jgi:hypothetical protein